MLILVTGKSRKAKNLALKFAENDDNIVFANFDAEYINYAEINFDCPDEIKDFARANEIELVADFDGLFSGCAFEDEIAPLILPSSEVLASLFLNNSSAKKFAYKNKVITPKFAVFDREAAAEEYLQTAEYPLIVRPDFTNETESPYAAETRTRAKERAEFLFKTGNRKIVIEDYKGGVRYTKYLALDGISALNLFETVSYFDEFSTNNIKYIRKEAAAEVENVITPLILDAFLEEGIDYRGILGLNFTADKNGEIFFEDFSTFFNELDVDIAYNIIEEEFDRLLYNCAAGTLGENYGGIKISPKYALSTDTGSEIISAAAGTMTGAVEILLSEAGSREKEVKKIIEEALQNLAGQAG